MNDHENSIKCTEEEMESLQELAASRTAGVWRVKRAKIILETLKGRDPDKLVFDVRVPPKSIETCLKRFSEQRLDYFKTPSRAPTRREARVERVLAFLEKPPGRTSSKWKRPGVAIIGRDFSAGDIQKIRALIESMPGRPRLAIAREFCGIFGVHLANGKINLSKGTDILKRMDMDNLITLPPVRSGARYRKRVKPPRPRPEPKKIVRLEQGEIPYLQLVAAVTREDLRVWRNIIEDYHYIKQPRLVGPQVKYLVYGGKEPLSHVTALGGAIKKEGGEDPRRKWRELARSAPRGKHLLAVMGFASSALRVTVRDDFIGWTDEQRLANLKRVVCNARFLMLPWIRSPNLASRILGCAARHLRADWDALYHFKPVLLETFVQLDRFKGVCYKAANWIQVGATNGYSLYGQKHRSAVPMKAVLLYPLDKNFRGVLRGG
ncbi:MAG: DUF4338 domain-containing protein [Desulfobacterales bacterium]|nr:DUF4338 domain-containing protein [Desulfobacterales bacterium]